MPVYNSAKYLGEAINSILNQTCTDFEFLIIDDGSSDDSVEIINSYKDDRIRLVTNNKNFGQSFSMNRGIKIAKGKYLAIMHADDISFPLRIEKQLKFMENNLEIGVCGAWTQLIGKSKGVHVLETDNDLIKIKLFTNQNLSHPAVMIRMKILKKHYLLYDTAFIVAQDYDLWVRMFEHCSFANLAEPLIKYRTHNHQTSIINIEKYEAETNRILQNLLKKLGIRLDNSCLILHNKIFSGVGIDSVIIKEAFKYLVRLRYSNIRKKVFEPIAFNEFLKSNWRRIMFKNNHKFLYWVSVLLFFRPVNFLQFIENHFSYSIKHHNA